MGPIRWPRAALLFAMTLGCTAWSPSQALAATPWLRADVHVGPQIDVPAFERAVALRYHIYFRKVVVADIDRDGDVDLVAATDRGFVVWLNDGAGHLTSQPPTHVPSVDGRATGNWWRGRQNQVEQPIQNDLPSVPLPGIYAHAPPAFPPAKPCHHDAVIRPETVFGCRTPRAPPA